MATFDGSYLETLAPVIETARKVLRDLERDEIPARLRKVAAYAGGRLPPPLADSLLVEIDGNEAFRAKVADSFEGSDEPSLSFLGREGTWWVAVASAASSRSAADAVRAVDAAEKALAAEREKASVLKKKLKAAIAPQTEAEGDDRSEGLKRALDRERADVAKLTGRVDELAAERAELEERLAGSEAARGDLYGRLRAVRADRAELLRRLERGEVDAVVGDPIDVARALDRMALAMAPYRKAATGGIEAGEDAEPTGLPPGIAPDTAAAVEALALRSQPSVLFVDGHNVIGTRAPGALGDPEARRRLVVDLGRLARRLPGSRITVVFDSALAGGREETVSAEGVVVRFSPPGATADDMLAEEAAASGVSAVVVSNDREVRQRVSESGALALWADALIRWLDA